MAQSTTASGVEIPFDLNKIFSLTYEFQPLKEVLEHIFGQLKKNADDSHLLDVKLATKFMLIEKLRAENEELKRDNIKIKNIQTEFEQKSNLVDQDLSNMKTNLENCLMNVSLIQRTTRPLPEAIRSNEDKIEEGAQKIRELEEKIAALSANSRNNEGSGDSENNGIGASALDQILNDYVKKNDLDDLIRRIEHAESKAKEANEAAKKSLSKVKKWKPTWKQMEKDIEELKSKFQDKVDCQLFDSEINNLKNLINSIGAKDGEIKPIISTGPSISSKELNEIRDALKQVAEHEDKISKIMNDLKGASLQEILRKINQLTDQMQQKADKTAIFQLETDKAEKLQVEGEFKRVHTELDQIRDWLSKLEDNLKRVAASVTAGGQPAPSSTSGDILHRVEKLEGQVSQIWKAIEELKNMKAMQTSTNFSETKVPIHDEDLANKFNALYVEVQQMKNEFARWLKEMQDALNSKADIDALNNLESSFMDRLNEIVKALTKQLADKNDTKKALKLLERQLKNLYDLLMTRGTNSGGHQHNANEDDAMFTKKPLGGMSCASCEKDIINLQGRKVDFLPWNKLPFRDPSERIARVGQGFSKMLSMINPDGLSQYNGNTRYSTTAPGHLSHKGSQEHFYPSEEMEDTVPNEMNGQRLPTAQSNNRVNMKTQNHFLQAQQMQDMSNRPGSAQVVPKPRVKSNFLRQNKK